MGHHDLKVEYTDIIDTLDRLYSAGMYRSFTEAELAQIATLKARADEIQPALAQCHKAVVSQTESLFRQQCRLLEQIGALNGLPRVPTLDEAQAETSRRPMKLPGAKS